jgi:hypothetical protein
MRLFHLSCLVCFTAAVLGCSRSDPRGSVKGTVTYQGNPIKAGTVYFYFEQGGRYQAELKSDGSYQLMDVPTGNAKVLVDNEPFNPDQKPVLYTTRQKQIASGYGKNMSEYDARMGKAGAKKDAPPEEGQPLSPEKRAELAKVYVKIPKKYTSDSTTPLTYTVERGRQVKNFELSD